MSFRGTGRGLYYLGATKCRLAVTSHLPHVSGIKGMHIYFPKMLLFYLVDFLCLKYSLWLQACNLKGSSKNRSAEKCPTVRLFNGVGFVQIGRNLGPFDAGILLV